MKTRLAAAGAALLGAAALFAAATPIPPPPERWVTDQPGFLSEPARRALDARLEAHERATGRQVLVWIGRTTGGTPIEDFAVNAFRAWAVGRKGLDDGLVLFVFAEDRALRFEVGYGLEGELPDVVAFRIIREVIAPRLQAGDRDGAIAAGIDAALAALGDAGGEGVAGAAPARESVPSRGRPLGAVEKIVIAILALGFLALLITNPTLAVWLLVNIASSGGRGSRGGGGWGGGGGRSGGGGASGSW